MEWNSGFDIGDTDLPRYGHDVTSLDMVYADVRDITPNWQDKRVIVSELKGTLKSCLTNTGIGPDVPRTRTVRSPEGKEIGEMLDTTRTNTIRVEGINWEHHYLGISPDEEIRDAAVYGFVRAFLGVRDDAAMHGRGYEMLTQVEREAILLSIGKGLSFLAGGDAESELVENVQLLYGNADFWHDVSRYIDMASNGDYELGAQAVLEHTMPEPEEFESLDAFIRSVGGS